MPRLQLDVETMLKPLCAEDAIVVFDLISSNRYHLDRWLRWSSSIQTLCHAETFIEQFQEKLQKGDGFHLGIWQGNALAGGVVCWYIHRANRNTEIGYWLGQHHTGHGLATRAVTKVVNYLLAEEGLHRVEMQCAMGNSRSRRIPERLGFSMEGVRRQSHWITDRFEDHAVYGMLAHEWVKLHGSAE